MMIDFYSARTSQLVDHKLSLIFLSDSRASEHPSARKPPTVRIRDVREAISARVSLAPLSLEK